MRKFLLFNIAVVLGAVLFIAATPTAPTIYGPNSWNFEYGWNVYTAAAKNSGGYQFATTNAGSPGHYGKADTLSGTDTCVFVYKYPIDPGKDYLVQVKDSVGGADSLIFEADVYGGDGNTIIDSSYALDSTFAASKFKMIGLPFNTIGYPTKLTLRVRQKNASGTTKIYRFELLSRKASLGF